MRQSAAPAASVPRESDYKDYKAHKEQKANEAHKVNEHHEVPQNRSVFYSIETGLFL